MPDGRKFTLGVEEEYQIIDPETRELRNYISQMVEASTPLDGVELQPELHQSVVEVATRICEDAQAVRREVIRNRKKAAEIAGRVGVRIAAASTHPFSSWKDQEISTKERYVQSVDEMQDAARANLIFGMHVHVGIPDRELLIAVYNQARYFLPHLLALSTSSPFVNGRHTGLCSTRSLIFRRLPRTGIPEHFATWAEFEGFLETLVATHCIDNGRRVWWDLRPHPVYQTLEFRVCDLPPLLDDVVTLAATVQAIAAKLALLRSKNLSFNPYRVGQLDENKWRAARYGVRGKLIDWGKRVEVPFASLAEELIEFVDDVLDELGSRKEVEGILRIAREGTSADRQVARFQETGSLRDVVDLLLDETMRGVE